MNLNVRSTAYLVLAPADNLRAVQPPTPLTSVQHGAAQRASAHGL